VHARKLVPVGATLAKGRSSGAYRYCRGGGTVTRERTLNDFAQLRSAKGGIRDGAIFGAPANALQSRAFGSYPPILPALSAARAMTAGDTQRHRETAAVLPIYSRAPSAAPEGRSATPWAGADTLAVLPRCGAPRRAGAVPERGPTVRHAPSCQGGAGGRLAACRSRSSPR